MGIQPRAGHAVAAHAENVDRVLGGQRRHVDHFEAGGAVAQQPQRPRYVTAGQHEAVAADGEAVGEIVDDTPQAGKALERAQFEKFVEQERGRPAAGRPGAAEQADGRVEGDACVARRRLGALGEREHRDRRERAEEALGRRRRPFDVDVLSDGSSDPLPQQLQERCSSAAAPAEQDRDVGRGRIERRGDAAGQTRTRGQHSPSSRIGIRSCSRSAVAIASG